MVKEEITCQKVKGNELRERAGIFRGTLDGIMHDGSFCMLFLSSANSINSRNWWGGEFDCSQ